MRNLTLYIIFFQFVLASCNSNQPNSDVSVIDTLSHHQSLSPALITEPSLYDTDDPAIWINKQDISKSLILGTDKGDDFDKNAALMVYDLEGKIVKDKSVTGLTRVNNVDIAYGFQVNGNPTDIALVTERGRDLLRIFSIPEMDSIDNGGIPVFEGEDIKSPMGIASYRSPESGKFYAIVSRKGGESESYLWQYELKENEGSVSAELVRKFGKFEGGKEIESIAVDEELGYIYFSDEGKGVRKYYAEPAMGNEELALFATEGFTDDHEGISIYKFPDGTGYILVSDQQANKFHIFPREGTTENSHQHDLLKAVQVSTRESDGSEITYQTFNGKFPGGLFVAMSDDKTFHFYNWADIAGDDLKVYKEAN
ncbi:phytase [Flexithrix dorotheae]|uniref:phytase n=1 Tax=Flexithrix dorotheae TaxID=70993 RepID=UPI00037E1505|nr:phytase [Flexithrix dorotheae]